jgi:putative membrane protein
MNVLIKPLFSGLAVLVAAYILPGIKVEDYFIAIIVAVVLGIVNAIIKPIILILTLPINILTLGLFTLIINGLLVLLVSNLVPGFHVASIWWAIAFSLVVSIVSSFLNKLVK